jgi:uncharacterized membrane protein
MGLMFLLAGYFVPRSYDRRGARLFLTRRWLRIGIPLAVIVLLVHLPVSYLIGGAPQPRQFLIGLYERGWQPIYLHLWFVAHLLLYCFAYAALRRIRAAAIADVTLPAFAKFAVVSLLGTAAAFALAQPAGQVPGIRAAVGATSGRVSQPPAGA